MALTEAGRRLTEEHRLAQLSIGGNAAVVSTALWSMLDPDDLDLSRPAWIAASVRAAELQFAQSADVARSYVTSYQAVEVPGLDEVVVVPSFNARRVAHDLDLAGPQYIKSLVRDQGLDPYEAHQAAQSRLMGIGRKHAADGGRSLIEQTTGQDQRSIGYRRVTGPDPCTFCAMVASRGASFGSQRSNSIFSNQETALISERTGKQYHLHCMCTSEIVYGEWIPTPEEQVYVDSYERAALEIDAQNLPRNQENVLSLMRADDDAAFRDSRIRRRNSPDPD